MENPVNIIGSPVNSILIVDDETANHIFLTHILSPEYTVYAAKDGESAIKKALEVSPDLILLDIIMPGISGYEVLAALKKHEETRDIPVIFITGLSSSEDEEKGLAFDVVVDYISKPFSAGIVKLRVRNQIKIINQIRTINLLSSTDQLTNMPNRRSFDNQLNRDWRRMVREKSQISIMLLDVDKFKVYNDTYGHQQGDVLLQEVAKILVQSAGRSSDFAARWGGEEFIILLPNTDSNGALDVAERIRTTIERATIPCADGSPTNVTVSIGINTLMPEQNSSVVDFIAQADKALYTAKETGRNRICRNC
ncbi:MAG: diguanylate cyclase [Synergistaceae bacterium]|nr:diguanylate cyclase [Synergistaceae bacterium]